jgi:hypothetical protein
MNLLGEGVRFRVDEGGIRFSVDNGVFLLGICSARELGLGLMKGLDIPLLGDLLRPKGFLVSGFRFRIGPPPSRRISGFRFPGSLDTPLQGDLLRPKGFPISGFRLQIPDWTSSVQRDFRFPVSGFA